MLEAAFVFKGVFDHLTDELPRLVKFKLNGFEWLEIKAFISFLNPLYDQTMAFQQSSASLSDVNPALTVLQVELSAASKKGEIC